MKNKIFELLLAILFMAVFVTIFHCIHLAGKVTESIFAVIFGICTGWFLLDKKRYGLE